MEKYPEIGQNFFQKPLDFLNRQWYTLIIKGKENKTMTREEMNKMERLAEIMFQEDEERYNNNQPLMYYTEEDFETEKAERKNNKSF